jgi:hypothetical protein
MNKIKLQRPKGIASSKEKKQPNYQKPTKQTSHYPLEQHD